MKPRYLRVGSGHRHMMTNCNNGQSHFYDTTRWMFLCGRETLIEQTDIRPGERVLEIGCGTGANFDAIQKRLQGSGELIALDWSKPMLDKAVQRVRESGWKNVRIIHMEYGKEPLTRGRADVVLFSYSLSILPNWELALACAHDELWPGGRIGVVDFCKPANSPKLFSNWLAVNHVNADRPYETELRTLFHETAHRRCSAWAGLWSFYLFVGMRRMFSIIQEAA